MNLLNVINDPQTLEQRNEAYRNMTVMERRVAIAKDALQWALNGHFNPLGCNGYVDWEWVPDIDTPPVGASIQPGMIEQFKENHNKCTVCGIGGLFLAKVLGYNNVNNIRSRADSGRAISSWIRSADCHIGLHDAFDSSTLDDIENYFESGQEGETDREVFISICRNIIDNNGKFTLEV